ncbi:helix-turn-helix domain-containing protein [Aquibacillus kalidii]|uniref:helix-turn-helix domain-containing protein n=1 Tax=Aquibacillus kalidii TaxID=2762597 RepID=UPI00164483E5|nr:helix-turn-helix transcriptional regulator [Aquibacillus kalidii]
MEDKEITREVFGELLREKRKANKLTQAQLAENAGISENYLGKIERGIYHPLYGTGGKIIDGLHMSHDLFWREFTERLENHKKNNK